MNKSVAVLPVLALLSGCATMGTPETVWQTMNAVDASQTFHIANSPECYREIDPLTSALVGETPSSGQVGLVMVGYAIGYHMVTKWLENNHPEYVIPWHVTMIAAKGYTITKNHNIGMRPFGRGC